MSRMTGKKRILAGFVSMAIAASFLSAMIVLADNPPTVHFDGLELRMVAEYETDEYGQYVLDKNNQPIPLLDSLGNQRQSVQALVSVSVTDVELNTGVAIPLHYNEAYLIPSDWKTNGEIKNIPDKGMGNDPTDPLHHYFFRIDEGLYAGKDPFDWKSAGDTMATTLKVDGSTDILTIHLSVDKTLTIPTTGDNKIDLNEWEYRKKKYNDTYIVCGSEKTVFGTISFRVNDEYLNEGTGSTEQNLEANLKKLVDKFNGSDDGYPVDPNDTSAPLIETYTTGNEKLNLWQQRYRATGYYRGPVDKEIAYRINIESEDVIIKAEPVKNEIVINAYEAFTNGEVSDLALAMQKYAESVRVTYVSENKADMSIYWGDPVVDPSSDNMPADGPGMFIQKIGDNTVYRFTWDPTDKTKYTFEEKQSDGSFLPVDQSTIYDPRGGDYMISQYFTYMENSGVPGVSNDPVKQVLKTYQTPIKVHLTVTPVKAIDAVVDKDSLTYLNDINEVPATYSALELADEARIVLDTTLNGVIPTVPVSWTPSTLDQNVTGVPGAGNPNPTAVWPFTMDDFTNKSGIGDYTFNTEVEEKNNDKTGVRDRYPWLTTDPWLNAGNDYKVGLTSMRYIVDTDTTELASRYVTWAEPYEMPLGDEIGRLRVTIARRDDEGTAFEDMASGYKFRLYMPNGMEIEVEPNQWFGGATGTNVWSDSTTNAYYGIEGPVGLGLTEGKNAYVITISPGILGATDAYASERETLRRYINLGGWFGVKVQAPGESVWTDLIPTFSEPRTNIYINSYNDTDQPHFDYTGLRSGLMPFYSNSNLPTFVTLPADDSVATRYDAFDGHQPGTLRQFKVDGWSKVSGDQGNTSPSWTPGEVVTYGEDLFARTHEYGDFGQVINPDTASGYKNEVVDREVRVDVQVQKKDDPGEDPEKKWDLLLTYEQTGDNISYIHNTNAGVDEVKRVTFESKQEGYTAQQIVTLTLTNTGNMEIKGLYIDIPTLNGALGPYFTIVSAPAVNLPAGAKTTFQISYVQNLPKGTYENIDTTLPVEIHHNNGEKNFEAVLRVTESKVHKVSIVVHPDSPTEGRVMGDAELVVGVDTTAGVDSYDGGMAGSTYEKDEIFWVLTTPKDEYSILTLKDAENKVRPQVYYLEDYIDPNGEPAQRKVYLNEYLPEGPNSGFGTPTPDFQIEGNERLFWLPMPDRSVTVHVHYYEPLLSKLRLSDLHAYAWDQENEAIWDDTLSPPAWQDSIDPNTNWWKYEKELHEPQSGNYNVITFDPKKDEYIVILDDESTGGDNWCGVSVTLRELETKISGVEPDFVNQDIYPDVIMTLDDGPGTIVGGTPSKGDTTGPTTHHSGVLESPTAKSAQNGIAQKTVIITISYDGKDLVPPEGEEKRVYKVRFVRKITGEARKVLMAGNSPYGMIENDETITDKAAAKEAFDVENRFAAGYTPHQATELTNIYWPEAWGDGINYDKDETALFVYLGQEFYDPGATQIYNNAGDLIDGIIVKRTLTDYYQMDTGAAAAIDRFSNGSMSSTVIDLGEILATNGTIPGDAVTVTEIDGTTTTYTGMVTKFADVTDIRPGIYRLTYTFEDYDHTTMLYFTRPVIILSPNGDVNADLSLTTNVKDADAIRKRFSTALPLELADAVYSEADRRVYQYRIVDANNDRNINNVDANMIRKVTALLLPSKPLTQFYRPTEYTYPIKP